MPEGDTIHHVASVLEAALAGHRIEAVDGSHHAVRREGRRLRGATVRAVEARGKHVLIHTDHGWTIRTHLQMTGRWRVYGPAEPWRISPGKARVVVRTSEAVAVCFATPSVEIDRTDRVLAGLERLGPDLTAPQPDLAEAIRRTRTARHPTLADLLLDQHTAAGIGNVYKSEVLFLAGLDPHAAPDTVGDAALVDVFARAARLLRANVADPRRTTTGSRGRQRLWVYDRRGRPCRRCGTAIRSDTHGTLDRVTYWCPTCQPPRNPDHGAR